MTMRYDYLCGQCQKVFEKSAGREETIVACPTCAQPSPRIITTVPGIIYRGTGWTKAAQQVVEHKEAESKRTRKQYEEDTSDFFPEELNQYDAATKGKGASLGS